MSYTELSSRSVTVRANKSCAWCAHRINTGERAQYRAYKFDGDFVTDWMHPECNEAMKNFPDQISLMDGWIPGDFPRPMSRPSQQQSSSQAS
jgi:hypothetical protein